MGCKKSEVRILSSRPNKKDRVKAVFFVGIGTQDLKLREEVRLPAIGEPGVAPVLPEARIAPVQLKQNAE